MSFQPSHTQPFTIEQAKQLEIDVLVAEVRRLNNSIKHLEQSQVDLLAALEEEEDVELRQAYDENKEVIASQKERIEIIRLALVSKVGQEGVKHYDLDIGNNVKGLRSDQGHGNENVLNTDPIQVDEDGIHL